MKTNQLKLLAKLSSCLVGVAALVPGFPISAQQVSPGWTSVFQGATNADIRLPVVAVDNLGHVYVSGSGPTNYSNPPLPSYLTTVKYDASTGAALWTNYCAALLNSISASPPYPCAIKTDTAGNVYVAAAVVPPGGGSYVYALVSYAPNGTQRWVSLAGSGEAYPRAMVLDNNGNVIVTGRAWTPARADSACVTIKYNGGTGAPIWTNRYQARAKGNAVAVDGSGNIYIAGQARVNNSLDYLVIKCDSAGNQSWLNTYDGPAGDTGDDEATALVLDSNSNLYVTGYMGGNPSDMYGTLKYNSSGNLVWSDVMLNPRLRGHATALAIDGDHLFVTGISTSKCLTVKCGTDSPWRDWVKSYGPANGLPTTPTVLVVDGFHNPIVAGRTEHYFDGPTGFEYHYEYYTFKCDGSSGSLSWSNVSDGWHQHLAMDSEYAWDDHNWGPGLALDEANNFYLAGTSEMQLYPNVYPYYYLLGATWKFNQCYPLINDQCSGAIALADSVTYSMSTINATSTGDPTPTCVVSASNGVWFTYTSPISGAVTVSTCGSSYDTVLQIMTGTCDFLMSTECQDDSPGCGLQANLTFFGTVGTTYRILVAGYNGATGNLSITASATPLKIKTQPVGGSADAGDSFTFTVEVIAMFPPTYQWQHDGNNIPGATNSTLTLTDITPADGGDYRVIVFSLSGSDTSSVASLSVDPALASALDTSLLTWSTGGGNGWFRTTSDSHDGGDSATCFSTSAEPWMQTSVTGPGTLAFWWTFPASLLGSDSLGFYEDDVQQVSIRQTGRPIWAKRTIYIGAGSHTLKWAYNWGSRMTGGPAGVNQVAFSSGATAAFIATQPAPQTTVAGSSATFTVGASGTPPLTYQWRSNGADIAGATNSSLTLANVQPVQATDYSVVVVNSFGSPVTSSNALLSVTTIPLAVAMDYAGPVWAPSGNAQWFGQVSVTHDGVDAAQSGWVTNNQSCFLDATLVGPGTLSFWWKVSSETNWDFLIFSVNGVQKAYISGEVDWKQQTFDLPAGHQALHWTYIKDDSISRGLDAAWLDQVSYDGPPILSISPLSPQQMMLSWPTSATGFVLQSTTNLAGTISWQSVTDVPAILSDNWSVTNPTGSRQFYRLKK